MLSTESVLIKQLQFPRFWLVSKNLYIPPYSFARFLSDSSLGWANHIQSFSLNQPIPAFVSITIETVYRLSLFMQIFPFFDNLAILGLLSVLLPLHILTQSLHLTLLTSYKKISSHMADKFDSQILFTDIYEYTYTHKEKKKLSKPIRLDLHFGFGGCILELTRPILTPACPS